jgi:hypothetical protein
LALYYEITKLSFTTQQDLQVGLYALHGNLATRNIMTYIGNELIQGTILIDNVIRKQIHRFVYLVCYALSQKRKIWVKSHKYAINILKNALKHNFIQRGTVLKNYVKCSISTPSLRQQNLGSATVRYKETMKL